MLLWLLAVPAAPSPPAVVRLQNTAVHPSRLLIRAGQRVTWRFLDANYDEAHNVTSYAGRRFASSSNQKTGTYSVRLVRPGTYLYHCTIHFNMKGRIVVVR